MDNVKLSFIYSSMHLFHSVAIIFHQESLALINVFLSISNYSNDVSWRGQALELTIPKP